MAKTPTEKLISNLEVATMLDWCMWTVGILVTILAIVGMAQNPNIEGDGNWVFLFLIAFCGLVRIRMIIRGIRIDALKRDK